jgi:hypothetical protein
MKQIVVAVVGLSFQSCHRVLAGIFSATSRVGCLVRSFANTETRRWRKPGTPGKIFAFRPFTFKPGNPLATIFLVLGAGLMLSPVSSIKAGVINAWINELHYANVGTDVGEFVEVVAPANVSDLANVVVTFYNGGDGKTYGPTGGTSQTLSTFTTGSSANGFTVYSKAINGIQNGPDGLALSYNGTLLQFLSYGGHFTGSGGVANGVASVDIGVQEYDSTTPSGYSLGLTGTGSQYSDFSWTTFSDDTPGAFNLGQTTVPEPAFWSALSAFGLFAICGLHEWRHRRFAGMKAGNAKP